VQRPASSTRAIGSSEEGDVVEPGVCLVALVDEGELAAIRRGPDWVSLKTPVHPPQQLFSGLVWSVSPVSSKKNALKLRLRWKGRSPVA